VIGFRITNGVGKGFNSMSAYIHKIDSTSHDGCVRFPQ